MTSGFAGTKRVPWGRCGPLGRDVRGMLRSDRQRRRLLSGAETIVSIFLIGLFRNSGDVGPSGSSAPQRREPLSRADNASSQEVGRCAPVALAFEQLDTRHCAFKL